MPPRWLAASSAWRRLPWARVLAVAVWLVQRGRERLETLSQRERDELTRLVRKSRGRLSNLSAGERERLRELVRKALTQRSRRA